MGRLTGGDLRRMAARTMLLQATFNYERQQGLGWAWALLPALERLYPDPELRRERLAEHTAYFNTQPTLASLALGAVAALEERRAVGEGPDAAGMARIKGVFGSSLAAIGDRLFWFTLRPYAACMGALIAVGGSWWGAAVLWATYNVLHLGLRFSGVGRGYEGVTAVLDEAHRRRFERMTSWLSLLGALLVGVLTAALLVPRGQVRPLVFQAALAAGLGLGLVAGGRARPSPTEWALGLGALCFAATFVL